MRFRAHMFVDAFLVVLVMEFKVFSQRAVRYSDRRGPTNSDRECTVNLACAVSRAYVC